MNWEAVAIILPGLVAGMLVLSTHVPLGREVLRRGIIFIDLAIAQIAGLGVIAAHVAGWESIWAVQAAALSAALAGALLLSWSEKRWRESQEALIGIAFVLAASAGLVLLNETPRGGEHLHDILAGQILWIRYLQLWPVALLYALILVIWASLGAPAREKLFYVLFAFTATASVQLVGIYLVFASLIIPALATRMYPPRLQLAAAYTVGLLGYCGGLLLSSTLDTPSGAAIVWSLGGAGLLAAFGSRSRFVKRSPR